MLKRFLLLFSLIISALSVSAQISAMHLGYCDGEVSTKGTIGISKANDVEAAVYFPQAMMSIYQGNSIESIKVGLASKLNIETLTVWIRESLDGENLVEATINNTDDPVIVKGWNDIKLPDNYLIAGDKGLYVGYSFHQKGSSYAISTVGKYQENSLFVKLGESDWESPTVDGALSLEAMVVGDNLPKYDLALIEASTKSNYPINSEMPVNVTVKNMATYTITGFDVVCNIEGCEEVYSSHIDCNLAYDQTEQYQLKIVPSGLTQIVDGLTMTVSITNLNEGEDEYLDNNSQTLNFNVISHEYERKVLVEEFTTEQCSNCPTGASMLHSAIESVTETYGDRVVATCHHSGFYTDWLTTSADSDYLWLFNAGGNTYAPGFMIDRKVQADASPVFSNPGVNKMTEMISSRLDTPAYADVKINATYDEDTSVLNVNVIGERSRIFCDNEPRLTVYVVENNIKAHSQAGASGEFTHQHVLRTYNNSWGEAVNWVDNKFDYNCELTIKNTWEKSELEIIAFLSDYNASDATQCTVENADKVAFSDIYDLSGIAVKTLNDNISVKVLGHSLAVTGDYDTYTVYNLNGAQVDSSSLSAGVYIVKVNCNSSSKAFKIFVK